MSLSLRLNTIVDAVRPCGRLFDVGCDHGYVSIELVKRNTVDAILALDINEGPLESARNNIALAGLSDRIETVLSDGLERAYGPCDAVIIAGMGGRLTERILTAGADKIKNVSQFLLQPQSEIFLVREWVRRTKRSILKETCLKDAGKYYFLLDVCSEDRPCEVSHGEWPDFFDIYSEYLIRENDALYREYLERGHDNNKRYLMNAGKDLPELEKEIAMIDEALALMGTK